MLKSRKFLIGGLIIFIALGYLGYTSFKGAATYYYTVDELLAQGSSIYGKHVRVNGQVAPGSVKQEVGGHILRFNLVDRAGSLPVVYQGIVPDAFKASNEIVIEGYLDSVGVFQANTILTKCPSKYVPKD